MVEWQPISEWAAPSFIQPKKNNTVCFFTDFREVNKRLVRKPFPLPKIITVLQQLEGFTYATALDLNMGYYCLVWAHAKTEAVSYIDIVLTT